MEKENELILKAKKIVKEAHEEYFKALELYSKNQDRDALKEAKILFALKRKEVREIKNSNPSLEYDPSLDFAYDIKKEEVIKKVETYQKELNELRKDGEIKADEIKEEIANIYLRKNIKLNEKKELCSPLNEELKKAKTIEKENKVKVNDLKKVSSFILKEYGRIYRHYVKSIANHKKSVAKGIYDENIKNEHNKYLKEKETSSKEQIKFLRIEHNSKRNEILRDYNEAKASAKDTKHSSYLDIYSIKRDLYNNKLNIGSRTSLKWENYKHQFKLGAFLLKYSLYIVILVFFIFCAIVAQTQGNPLLTVRTVETIMIQSSTKVFFSLGVAGLILLGGTDLSIGRMTGMAATFSCLIMSQLIYETNIGVIDMTIPQGIAIVLGIFVCVFSTTLFSAIAGFFSSKLKMHPFITTLSTQLLIYGIMMVCFSQVPAFTMDPTIKGWIVGESGWRLILYAVIIIFLVWLIWNKTKFGKNMYAVGDNKEAAAISGINVFWVSMGVFIMAGILYGLGGFLEGARIGNANPSTALGTELDAIAACVIGGISFSGGKGKVSGVVIGTIIFSTLTYCLTYIGLDINYQYIFKGLIILAAVCLDSIKLIKKK